MKKKINLKKTIKLHPICIKDEGDNSNFYSKFKDDIFLGILQYFSEIIFKNILCGKLNSKVTYE